MKTGSSAALRALWACAFCACIGVALDTAAQSERPSVGQAPQPQNQPPAVAPITDAVTVLTPQGRFVLEPSFQFSHSSDSRVTVTGFTIIPAITIGVIDVRSVDRDFWSVALTGRYGLGHGWEVEAKVPWVYRSDSTLARPISSPATGDSEFRTSGSGLGDIEFAARYQITERPPYYIGYLRFKSRTGEGPFDVSLTTAQAGVTIEDKLPTGTGFYAFQPGFTVLVPSDPAVFFGGLSYIWNVKRTVGGADANGVPIGEFDPGDGINLNFGMGLAINDRASFSMGYDHSRFDKNKRNGETIQNTQIQQVGSVLFGVSYRLGLRTNMNLTLGIGATRAAPDVSIALRFPIVF
jgi:hypothetical protein